MAWVLRAERMRSVPFRSRMRSLRELEGLGSGLEGISDVVRYEGSGDVWRGGGGVGERLGVRVGRW